ncbi:MAG: hypothetical protein KGM99_01150 [Burkholderiales bacterium]|nr:hypothetical protein [Burkholderiales bacterium]
MNIAADTFRQKNRNRWLLYLLLPALMLAQWVGLSHRMSHFSGADGKPVVTQFVKAGPLWQLYQSSTTDNAGHSCSLYDAATSPAYLHALPPVIVCQAGKPVATPERNRTVWLARIRPPFSSRAPPSFLSI